MEKEVLSQLFEELMAVKEALEIDCVREDKVKQCLDEFFPQLSLERPFGLLTLLIQKEHISQSQAEFLRGGVKKEMPAGFDISDRVQVENLVISKSLFSDLDDSIPEPPREPEKIQAQCPHCQTAYKFKIPSKTSKLRCAKCCHAFYITGGTGEVSKEFPVPKDPAPIKPFSTINLNRDQVNKLQQGIAMLRQRQAKTSKVEKTKPTRSKAPAGKGVIPAEALPQIPGSASPAFSKASGSISSVLPPAPQSTQRPSLAGEPDKPQSLLPTCEEVEKPQSLLSLGGEAENPQSLWTSDEEDEFADDIQSPQSENQDGPQSLFSMEGPNTEEQKVQADHFSESLSTPLPTGVDYDLPTSEEPSGGVDYDLPTSEEPSGGVDYDLPGDDDMPVYDFSSESLKEKPQEAVVPPIDDMPKEELPNFNFDSATQESTSGIGLDSLKLPEEETVESFDLLNISPSSTEEPEEPMMRTMELDIRTTPLFKDKAKSQDKPGTKTTKAFLKVIRDIKPEESLVIVKYAINYDYIAAEEAKEVLDTYFDTLTRGERTENPASLLLLEGYITKFQYDTLLEALEKDRNNNRIPKGLDMASRQSVDKYLGSTEEKKLMRISCPNCKTTFRVRVSTQGGKFRCGKCHKSFFMKSKKK